MKKPQLFLVHFAGGNHYSFNRMSACLHDFEIVPLELPGRGRRMQEEVLKDFDLAANDLYCQIIKQLNNTDFLIYGHSMGAFLTLRLTKMLIAANKSPLCMVVSGNSGPGINRGPKRYNLEHEQFMMELRKLGGIPEEVLQNEELLNMFLPVLRADFEIAEENKLNKETPVGIPIYAIMGEDEEYVNRITNWGRFTSSKFDYKLLPGGHFFIFNHAREMANIIRSAFANAASLKQ